MENRKQETGNRKRVNSTGFAVPVFGFLFFVASLIGSHAAAESCPYQFDGDMPAGTFCVYRGVARGGAGEECATDVVVIWSSAASQASVSDDPGEETSASSREVYLGFVAAPELVVRAIVEPRQSDRAEILEYTLDSEATPWPLTGEMALSAAPAGDVLNLNLGEARHFHAGDCTFASYSGTFLGMLRPPRQTSSVDALVAPRQ